MSLRLYTASEAGNLLGLTEHMVRREKAAGRLPFRQVGRFVRFADEDLAAYVQATAALESPGVLRRAATARNRKRRSA